MYTFFERGIHCDMPFTNKRRVCNGITTIDNKEYMNHLGYVDENNLCGLAMCQPQPHSEIFWVEDPSVFTRDFILGLDEEEDRQYTGSSPRLPVTSSPQNSRLTTSARIRRNTLTCFLISWQAFIKHTIQGRKSLPLTNSFSRSTTKNTTLCTSQ